MARNLTIEQFTQSNASFVTLNTPINNIIVLFEQLAVSQIPVVQDGQLQGVIYRKYLQRPFIKENITAKDLMTKNGIKIFRFLIRLKKFILFYKRAFLTIYPLWMVAIILGVSLVKLL